ncbi:MAG: hypothetical protein GTN82_35420 [Candidatus Aminicenantes bacterium]|nr:hypothetical protein [Candidatus Aminicenantes bacterium]
MRINIHSRAYHMLGNFQRELELARKGQEIFPGQMEFFIIEAQALAAFGKIEEVKKVIDKSLRISSLSGTPGNVMWMAALELRAHGHIKAYREIVKRTAAWYKNRPPQEAATEKHRYNLARVLYLAEQWDESERISKDLAEKKPDNIEYKGNLGVLAARKGNQKEARQVLEQLKNMNRPYLFGRHTYWCARIASLLDEKQRAVELLKESFAQGMIYRIDLHREIDFEPIKDFPPFKELIQPKVRESL